MKHVLLSGINASEQPMDIIESLLENEPNSDRENIIALTSEEWRHIHEGVLARYGIRPSQ
ncbi:hypothetical protein L0B53_16005 [Vibrio sp. SS-MA-C1-2]|uniref:hypothetical protein n=1 Tax=Vibrio sp. SS-MA-C1-2 TaxID=2908646 RepID=UPI001F246ECF|nr:hypothetical protein [Vibrio sp. SS-MA-C1-2]UJF18507.1 hypothetical protein L0B53_16005 [Vibrio sp. SS-MA-C1-2]